MCAKQTLMIECGIFLHSTAVHPAYKESRPPFWMIPTNAVLYSYVMKISIKILKAQEEIKERVMGNKSQCELILLSQETFTRQENMEAI